MGFQRYQAIDLTTNSLSGICKRNRFLTENKVLKYQFFHINPTINGNGLEIAGEKAVFNRESGNTSCREVYRILSPQNMVGDRLSTFFKWAKMVQKVFKVQNKNIRI